MHPDHLDHDTHIPTTTARRATFPLLRVAQALVRLGCAQGGMIPLVAEVARAALVSERATIEQLNKLRRAGVLERVGAAGSASTVVADGAALSLAATPAGAADLEAQLSGEDGARTEARGPVTLATLGAAVEAMLAEVTTLRAAVQEGVNRVGAVEAALARAVAEVVELRARLDAAAVAPLPLAPRPAPPAEVEPTAEDMDRLRRLILDVGSHGAAALKIGSTKNAVWKALRRGSVSPRMAAALRALDSQTLDPPPSPSPSSPPSP